MPLDMPALPAIRAAGILIRCGDKALFVKRGPGSDYPGMWAFPGGRMEEGETADQTAERETREEIGAVPYGNMKLHTRSINNQETASVAPILLGDPLVETLTSNLPPMDALVIPATAVDFTTFTADAKNEFKPTLNDEHVGYAWAPIDQPPEPLHPGCRIALQKFTMNELDIARAMAAGSLVSPQQYMGLWLYAMRITGTGLAFREAKNEYVWRDINLHLNEDFLARCNGLAVIWWHPPKSLNTKEYRKRVIGAIMLPYALGDEVWGIAKIQDADAAQLMADGQYSTSPSVILGGITDKVLKTADGTPLLIEGEAALLDHLAVCEQGVWDKGGEPVGVQNDIIERDLVMADSAAQNDDGKKFDAVMDALRAGMSRMDALHERLDKQDAARKDAEEEEKKERAKEDAARRDTEKAEWMKADGAMCAKDDADEEEEKKSFKEKGDPEEVAADKARKARKDRMAARDDAARKDAEEKEAKKKEEQEKADAATRSDSIAKQVQDGIAAALAKLQPKEQTADERTALADAQVRADSVYGAFGKQAPPPMAGETTRDYRVRLLKGMQMHSEDWKAIDVGLLAGDAIVVAEKRIYADAVAASKTPADLRSGELREFVNVDGATGIRTVEFRGKEHFIALMGQRRPSRRMTAFRTDQPRH